jgi:hypothetical protein
MAYLSQKLAAHFYFKSGQKVGKWPEICKQIVNKPIFQQIFHQKYSNKSGRGQI